MRGHLLLNADAAVTQTATAAFESGDGGEAGADDDFGFRAQRIVEAQEGAARGAETTIRRNDNLPSVDAR